MFLLIDTSTNRGIVALCDSSKVLFSRDLTLGLGNSRELERALVEGFAALGKRPLDLEFVAVGRGPGSYTGMRVGAASAKALSLSLNIPLVGVSTLRAFLPPKDYSGPCLNGTFLAAIDAKIGGVYLLRGVQEGGTVRYVGQEQLVPQEVFLQEVRRQEVQQQEVQQQEVQQVGCLVTPHAAPLKARLGDQSAKLYEVGIDPSHFAKEAYTLFLAKEYSTDGSLELLYLRATQAEMEKLPNKAITE